MAVDPKREPTADQRQFAGAMYGLFSALVLEGFTEVQALQIIGNALTASIQKPKDDGS